MVEIEVKFKSKLCKCSSKKETKWAFGNDGLGHYMSFWCQKCKTTITLRGDELSAKIIQPTIVNNDIQPKKEIKKVKKEVKIPGYLKVIETKKEEGK